jgi:ligand-binding sensor domain-containing protein
MTVSRLPRRWTIRLGLCVAPALAVGLLLLCFYLSAVAPVALADSAVEASSLVDGTGGETVFTHDDGLAANSVTALLRDDRVLWVGTTAGLSRYTLRGRDAGLIWETFTQVDGMATDAISDLWRDDAGRLWVAHPDGQVSNFDDGSWTTFESVTQTLTQAYKQIVDDHVAGPLWAVEEGGRVWTLADGTVGYYVGAVWRPYGEDTGIPGGRLVAVWTGDGAWVASENGQIGYFDGVNWTTYRNVYDAVQNQYETIAASGPTTGPLWVVDQENAVWVRNAFNQRNPQPDVRRFVEGRWTNFSGGDGMASGFVEELRLDKEDRIWARHAVDGNGEGGGLSLYIGQQPDQGTGTNSWMAIVPTLNANVSDFSPEGTDGVWVGSFYRPDTGGIPVGGLTYVNLDRWQHFPLEALDGSSPTATWLDENNNLWLGLASDPLRGLDGGLWHYRPPQDTRLARWTKTEGLLDDDVRDLWGDGQGNLWVATAAGVNRITLKNRKVFSYTQPVGPDRIAGDAQGNVWAATLGQGAGVWQWDGRAWTNHTDNDRLSEGTYSDMHVSTDGDVYLAGDRGLEIWDGQKWKTFSALPGRQVKQIWQDSAGDLWLSTEITPGRPFNLSLNRGGTWQTVISENDSREMGSEPLALLRDGRGVVWLGTPFGLFVYEQDGGSRWRGLGPADGLPAGPATALYDDANRTVWVAIGEQVYRSDHLPCNLAAASHALSATPVHQAGQGGGADELNQLGTSGGCGNWVRIQPNVGVVSRITAGPDGDIVFAGDAGVALYQPESPDLRLEGVTNLITGEAMDTSEPVILTLGRNAVRINLTAIAPTLAARQLSYRYRLEGADNRWWLAPAYALGGREASVSYAGLPGGVYTFTAAIRTDALDYSPDISFTIYVLSRPPELFLDQAMIAGRPAERPGTLQSYVDQPIQIQLSSNDDQPESLTYRYRIEGLGDNWTETTSSEISFTLSTAGIYTFVAIALDGEGQSSELVGSQIEVSGQAQVRASNRLPVELIAAGLGVLAVLFIGSAVVLTVSRKRRESW